MIKQSETYHMDLFVQIFTIYKDHAYPLEIHCNEIVLQWEREGWINILSTNDPTYSASVQLTETGIDIIKFYTEL